MRNLIDIFICWFRGAHDFTSEPWGQSGLYPGLLYKDCHCCGRLIYMDKDGCQRKPKLKDLKENFHDH